MARNIDELDRSVYLAVAQTDGPLLDRVMPMVSRAADHSVLWMAIAAGLIAARGQRTTWAAQRGLTNVAVTSVVANQLAKRLHNRLRPEAGILPAGRAAIRRPRSSSFPSGHSASAAAFAIGVATEHPLAGVGVGLLAGAVGLSRVATGAHYPSDVVAGFTIGATIGAIGAKVYPPVPIPVVTPVAPPAVHLPARPTGAGVCCVINPRSGGGTGLRVLERTRELLPDAEFVDLTGEADIDARLAEIAARSEVLAVGGGDGTIRSGAQAALAAGVPLAVLPAGTFNNFARSLELTVDRTVAAIGRGEATKVDVGVLGDRIFLNTASAGSYPEFVQRREKWEERIGKPLAATYAVWQMMRHGKPFRVTYDEQEYELAALFVGNCGYHPPGFAPRNRPRMDDGLIDIRFVETGRRLAGIRFLGAVLTGRLGRSPLYHELHVPEATIELHGGAAPLARDGEVMESASIMRLSTRYRALTVYRPSDR